MKRNLLQGIILISAMALSSCSTLNQISKTSYTGDDVYFTKAQAGDSFDYMAAYAQAQPAPRNDDYYYYGDYESRINRFGYFSPFAYDDDFYYGYNPYAYNTFSYGFGPSAAPFYDYAYSPFYDLGVYSAFDFGYGNYWGYGNYGYGYAYSGFIVSGGVSKRNRINTYPQIGGSIGAGTNNGSGLAFSRGGTGNSAATALANGLSFSRGSVNSAYSNSRPISTSAVFPGRSANATASNGQTQQTNTVRNNNNPQQPTVRPMSENPRTYSQPTVERSSSSGGGGGGSTGSSSSSGGGGRPVRP